MSLRGPIIIGETPKINILLTLARTNSAAVSMSLPPPPPGALCRSSCIPLHVFDVRLGLLVVLVIVILALELGPVHLVEEAAAVHVVPDHVGDTAVNHVAGNGADDDEGHVREVLPEDQLVHGGKRRHRASLRAHERDGSPRDDGPAGEGSG